MMLMACWKDQWGRLHKDQPAHFLVVPKMFVQRKALTDALYMDHDEHHKHARCFRYHRRDGGAVKADLWKSELPIDQCIIEENIRQCFCQCSDHQVFALIGAH